MIRKSLVGDLIKSWLRAVAISLVLGVPVAYSESPVASAKWLLTKGLFSLSVDLNGQLSKKQLILINSGFSTYTALELFLPDPQAGQDVSLSKVECSVNFDTWEETYDVVRIDQNHHINKAKNFEVFASNCLRVVIDDASLLTQYLKTGGAFNAVLRIDQISADRAQKIRDWLVKQQQGVVKGLFSHMLGDIQVSEVITLKVEFPPYASLLDSDFEHEIIAIYPNAESANAESANAESTNAESNSNEKAVR